MACTLTLGALSYPGVLHWLFGKQEDPQLYSAFFEALYENHKRVYMYLIAGRYDMLS